MVNTTNAIETEIQDIREALYRIETGDYGVGTGCHKPIADANQHPAEAAIQVIETHISWVFLAGDYAYKIKKPIKNSFLDYTSLELRKRFCETELRLNQRFAKDLYLGVVAIVDDHGQLRINGTGKPIEYAVKMKRFPANALLSDRLVQGLVSLHDVKRLAAHIAGFHQLAAQAEPSTQFGSPPLVYQEALENIRDIADSKIDRLSDMLYSLRHWTETHYTSHQKTFLGRKLGGHIRECHGDLHLSNIVRWQDELIPFDGIEFCEEFRWIDTLSDAAFTAMDFAAHGRMDFCHSFCNAYFEVTGDYESIPILNWYLVYRALVRAKVATIRFAQTDSNALDHAKAEADVETLVTLAKQLSVAANNQPCLWITNGVSGSGKTTGSEKFVQQFGAIRVRADVERKRLAGLKPADRSNHDDEGIGMLYSNEMNARTYQRLAELAEQMIRGGTSVVVDATFLMKSQRTLFRNLAYRLKAPYQILAFQADPEVLRQRIVNRMTENKDASDADVAVLESQLQYQERLDADEWKLATVFKN